ncbi:MAG TPA: response regulator transcription factor [Bryobacteraceae bacterium]|jgi:DNA-binding NarL/FixJ family response regulator|nr:response regulator transcription factor [Bryobacteraceae bacterium]
MKLRILLGDDHALMLKGIRGLLEGSYEVVGQEENGRALVDAALRLTPDLVVLDISMPGMNGIEAARAINQALPQTKLVFLSMHATPIYLREALKAGASAYVLKSGAAEELLTAVEEAQKGSLYITPGFWEGVTDVTGEQRANAAPKVALTERQQQILELLSEGKRNKEIAQIASLSVRTVEFHRSRLMIRFRANTVAELTKFAMQEGLIGGPRVAV